MPATTSGKCFKVTVEHVSGGTTMESSGVPAASASWAAPDMLSHRIEVVFQTDSNELRAFCLAKLLSCIKSGKSLTGVNSALDTALAS